MTPQNTEINMTIMQKQKTLKTWSLKKQNTHHTCIMVTPNIKFLGMKAQ